MSLIMSLSVADQVVELSKCICVISWYKVFHIQMFMCCRTALIMLMRTNTECCRLSHYSYIQLYLFFFSIWRWNTWITDNNCVNRHFVHRKDNDYEFSLAVIHYMFVQNHPYIFDANLTPGQCSLLIDDTTQLKRDINGYHQRRVYIQLRYVINVVQPYSAHTIYQIYTCIGVYHLQHVPIYACVSR